MSINNIAGTTAKPQKLELRPILDPVPFDDATIDVYDSLSAETAQVDTYKTSSLQGRVSPEPTPWFTTLSPNCSDDESGYSYDDHDDLECPEAGVSSLINFSPESSPDKMTSTTPETVKSLTTLIKNNDLGWDLTPNSKKKYSRAVNEVKEWKSPYKAKDDIRLVFIDALEQTGAATEVPSPSTVKRRLFAIENHEDKLNGDWTKELSKIFGISFLYVIHLTDLEKKGGFHICGKDHPLDRFVIRRRTNLKTGVWCGQVCEEVNPLKIVKKFTSFIPREMDLERYKLLICQALNMEDCKLAQHDNRSLYRVFDEKTTFVIECYWQEKGTLIKSAMPIFHYQACNGIDKSFQVEYCNQESLDAPMIPAVYEVVFEQLFDLLPGCPEAIVYNTEDKLIVDVGILYNKNPKYGTCPIDKGVLVEIPKIYSNFIL